MALVFPTQLEAVEYLTGQGFKLDKSKLNVDLKKGRLPQELEGGFFQA